MMCQNMGMIAEKLTVLWPVMLGGRRRSAPPPCSFHTVLQAAAYRVNDQVLFFIANTLKTRLRICLIWQLCNNYYVYLV